jgi:hypothetical protein
MGKVKELFQDTAYRMMHELKLDEDDFDKIFNWLMEQQLPIEDLCDINMLVALYKGQ